MKHIAFLVRVSVAVVGVAAFSSLSNSAQAQGPGNGGPRPGATEIPIDGGASLLLAAGAAYGLRRLRQSRQRPA